MLAYTDEEVMEMLVSEVSKKTNTTKKAIEYYVEKKLIFPIVQENGYREINESDVCTLKKIVVLRKLGVSIEDIKTVLQDETGVALQKLSITKELEVQQEIVKKEILEKLSCGIEYEAITKELENLEKNTTIAEKLLEVFPDWYGRFIWLHFARFLNEPVVTDKQKAAYGKLIGALDNMPTLELSPEVEKYMMETTKSITNVDISELVEVIKKSMENIDSFLEENKEILDSYLEYKKSDEYRNSLPCKFREKTKEFYKTTEYMEIVIPAMKELSSSYYEYTISVEKANEKLIAKYPEIEEYDL